MTKKETLTAKQANRALLNITVMRAKKIVVVKTCKINCLKVVNSYHHRKDVDLVFQL
jgi:hypothetical protein